MRLPIERARLARQPSPLRGHGLLLAARGAQRLACAWAVLLALCLGPAGAARAQDEVPFVVTPDNVTLAMLELAQVGPADYVLDLGSGDGRIVILAARRFGARGLGVEIVAELVERSRKSAAKAGVADRARFVEQDLFKTDLSQATVITMYLLQEVNLQLRPALLALRPGTRIVSHDWDMGEWKPDRTVVVDAPDKPVGLEKRSRLHLWVVPAKAAGLWCGSGAHRGTRLQMTQQFQRFEGTLVGAPASAGAAGATLDVAGHIDGTRLHAASGFVATVEGARLNLAQPGTLPAALQGAEFERCAG